MGFVEWAERRQRQRDENFRKAGMAVGRAALRSGRVLVGAAPSMARTAGIVAIYGLVIGFAIIRIAMSLVLWTVALGALFLMARALL